MQLQKQLILDREDLEAAEKIFGEVLGTPSYKREEVLGEAVLTSFFEAGGSKVELLVPTSPDSAFFTEITRFAALPGNPKQVFLLHHRQRGGPARRRQQHQ